MYEGLELNRRWRRRNMKYNYKSDLMRSNAWSQVEEILGVATTVGVVTVDGGSGGSDGKTSASKPGRNRSTLSCVAAHKAFCRPSRVSSPWGGGTSEPVAFMTSTTFLRDSGMASYYNRKGMTECFLEYEKKRRGERRGIRTNWSLLSIFINLSNRSRTWIHKTRISSFWLSLASKCINALHNKFEARSLVSGIPIGSLNKTWGLRSSSRRGKITRLKSSLTWSWSSGLRERWVPRIMRWRWAIAVFRISREVLEDWRAREVNTGRPNGRQTVNENHRIGEKEMH